MGSPLAALAARREELVAELVEDVPVPRWSNPALTLRIQPVEHGIIDAQRTRASKMPKGKKRDEAVFRANAVIVAAGTVEVVVGDDDVDQVTQDLTDPEFLSALGLPEDTNRADVIMRISLRDGDVLTLARKVVEISGYVGETDEEFLGE